MFLQSVRNEIFKISKAIILEKFLSCYYYLYGSAELIYEALIFFLRGRAQYKTIILNYNNTWLSSGRAERNFLKNTYYIEVFDGFLRRSICDIF